MPKSLETIIAECLEHFINPGLEANGVPLHERPLVAAVQFVDEFVLAVRLPGTPEHSPGKMSDFVATTWFRFIFKTVKAWYQIRLGPALTPAEVTIAGVILIYGVPFRLAIPTTVTAPGKLEDNGVQSTFWLQFPNRVLDKEIPGVLTWFISPPNFDAMQISERETVTQQVIEVATALRSIRTSFMEAGGSGGLLGLQKGVLTHLEGFVSLIETSDSINVQKAHWELQMACESAFKAVTLQRTGRFRETHDLFTLYNDLNSTTPLKFNRDKLKALPRSDEMIQLRYAQGKNKSLPWCFECYRVALAITEAIVAAAGPRRIVGLGNAKVQLRLPPWDTG